MSAVVPNRVKRLLARIQRIAIVAMRLNEAGLHVIEFGRWTPLARRCPMDESTPKDRKIGEKRPWTAPVLRRLDVGLTSAKDDSSIKILDGGLGHLQHS